MEQAEKFIDRINLEVNKLNKQKEFIIQCIENPKISFDRIGEYMNKRDTVFQIMNGHEDKENKLSAHQFQKFLCDIVNTYFEQVFKDPKLTVKVRNGNSFPSIFAVYYDNVEVIQFDVFQKYYGKKDEIDEQVLIENHNKQLNDIKEKNVKCLAKLQEYKFALEHTYRWISDYYKNNKKEIKIFKRLYYKAKDLIFFTFKKKTLLSSLEKKIKQKNNEINQLESEWFRHEEAHKKNLSDNAIRKEITELVEPLFVKHLYRLETEKHKLY